MESRVQDSVIFNFLTITWGKLTLLSKQNNANYKKLTDLISISIPILSKTKTTVTILVCLENAVKLIHVSFQLHLSIFWMDNLLNFIFLEKVQKIRPERQEEAIKSGALFFIVGKTD